MCTRATPNWPRARHGGSSRGSAARHHERAGAFERGFQDRPQGRAAPAAARSHQPVGARPDVARANRGRGRRHCCGRAGKQNHALNQVERKQLVADVLDELLGLGPIEPLLKDPTITDILVNGANRVFVERYGIIEPTPVRFRTKSTFCASSRRSSRRSGRRVDPRPWSTRALPTVAASTPLSPAVDRRFDAFDPQILPCPNQHGPARRDRQHSAGRLSRYSRPSSPRAEMSSFPAAPVPGKTTLLNAMSAYIDNRERIADRGQRRASASAEPCRAAGDTPAEHRGQGRNRPARPRQERAAHAARPDHRW